MVVGSLFFSIILWIIGLFILYLVVSTAVKDGINKSAVGQYIEEKKELTTDRKSFLYSDLDNEK
jgi:hypothetical protein